MCSRFALKPAAVTPSTPDDCFLLASRQNPPQTSRNFGRVTRRPNTFFAMSQENQNSVLAPACTIKTPSGRRLYPPSVAVNDSRWSNCIRITDDSGKCQTASLSAIRPVGANRRPILFGAKGPGDFDFGLRRNLAGNRPTDHHLPNITDNVEHNSNKSKRPRKAPL